MNKTNSDDMTSTEFNLSPEAQAQLQAALRKMIDAFDEIRKVLVPIIQEFLERVRKLAEQLARFFLKMQLLEWRVPQPLADFIAAKIPWHWAWKIGMRWFHNKLSAFE
jgi:hypothetical protein